MVEEIIKVVGGAGVLIAIVAWITRTLVIHWLARDIEAHKVRLKQESDHELERAKNDLKRAAFQYETRFTRLHDEIVKAILDIYPRLFELYQSFLSYMKI